MNSVRYRMDNQYYFCSNLVEEEVAHEAMLKVADHITSRFSTMFRNRIFEEIRDEVSNELL